VFESGTNVFWGLKITNQNKYYIAGGFSDTLDVDPGPLVFPVQCSSVNLVTNPQGYARDEVVIKLQLTCQSGLPADLTPAATKNICFGNQVVLLSSGTGTLHWYISPTSTSFVATGSSYTASPAIIGTSTYYVGASACLPDQNRAAIVVTVNACTGLNKNEEDVILIIPNPASDFIKVKNLSSTSIESIQIFDNTGNLIKENSENINDHIDLSELPNGFYLLDIKTKNEETIVKKLLVNR
jgi:hypothetical protein